MPNRSANRTRTNSTSSAKDAGPGVPRTPQHGFLEDDVASGHEHGERSDAAPREDALIGSAGSHTPAPDSRAEEPSGEVTPSTDPE